ncbi:MAG: endonuclease/exonuclease/phosphatase family protein [Prosthecobacter sp.]|uniref:endonuclease/exonuclease/phosphatase family protein n=1 Tax=Prosthecobacter sp. TaxID=1965333 RepID=UPI003903715B
MRIAAYNVENLFSRTRAMNGDDPAKTTDVLADVAILQGLIEKPVYSDADKVAMLKLLKKHKALGESGPFFLQETRRRLVSNGKIIADGRGGWIGWIEWRRDLFQAPMIQNTGRVITAAHADVLCLVEVENRPVLRRFNETILGVAQYPHAMVIDGNDERGIDVGVMSRFPIVDMRSHVDDPDAVTKRPVFSRDCAEFEIDVPGSRKLWILCNHFKSRGYGSKADNDAKRKRQAARVVEILKRFDLAKQWVVVAGDLNELPGSDSLAPLLGHAGLRNVFDMLPAGEDRWTHRDDAVPSKNDQIDYLLVSAALASRLQKTGIDRTGIWASAKKTRDKHPPIPTVTGDTNAASDHALVWADFDLKT